MRPSLDNPVSLLQLFVEQRGDRAIARQLFFRGALRVLRPHYRDAHYLQDTVVEMDQSESCFSMEIITSGWEPDGTLFRYDRIQLRQEVRIAGRGPGLAVGILGTSTEQISAALYAVVDDLRARWRDQEPVHLRKY